MVKKGVYKRKFSPHDMGAKSRKSVRMASRKLAMNLMDTSVTATWTARRNDKSRRDLRSGCERAVRLGVSMTSKISICPKVSGMYLCWSINFGDAKAA
jgi:hypothetical protein